MKEAFGGTFTIKLLMVFFVIYVTFLGVALNIAKSYRIKNGVINILEQNLYDGKKIDNSSDIGKKLNDYLVSIPYTVKSTEIEGKCKSSSNGKYVVSNGVCIIPGGNTIVEENGTLNNYYIVTIYMNAKFPFFDINMTFPISGETMTIYAN